MTVSYKQYLEDKQSFFKKHNFDYHIHTSSMDEYGRYSKTYAFEDGAQWFELMSPEYIAETIEVKLVKVDVEVKMFKTEYWSTESQSKCYYEKF